jgi:signal transduction histidine kinase
VHDMSCRGLLRSEKNIHFPCEILKGKCKQLTFDGPTLYCRMNLLYNYRNMSVELLLHNIGYVSSAVIAFVLAIFVYLKGRRQTANIVWGLGSLCVAIFCLSHVIGVNVKDPDLSRQILSFNMVNVLLTAFMAHCVFLVIGEAEKQKKVIVYSYFVAVALMAIYIIFPDTFLLPSQPKLYFPNYYVPGSLDWLMRIFFNGILAPYFTVRMFFAYHTADMVTRNRIRYFFIASLFGYGLGSLAIPLIYNIQIDPLLSAFFVPLYSIPMSYALVRYHLMDIKVIAIRAAIFAAMVAAGTFGIFLVGLTNSYLSLTITSMPNWVVPLLAGLVAATIGVFVWRKFREADMLKYEFVTIVTHKLRTPLTSIKWSLENLTPVVPSDHQADVSHIKESANKLVELTNILADVSNKEQESYIYKYHLVDIREFCLEMIKPYQSEATEKNINIQTVANEKGLKVKADVQNLKSVIQILIDNAIHFTPEGGHILLSISSSGKWVVISVKDSGMGIKKEELHLIFSRLFRTDTARKMDTEGMGLGLYLAKKIIERHGGKIIVESEGIGHGAKFSVWLPVVRKEIEN